MNTDITSMLAAYREACFACDTANITRSRAYTNRVQAIHAHDKACLDSNAADNARVIAKAAYDLASLPSATTTRFAR